MPTDKLAHTGAYSMVHTWGLGTSQWVTMEGVGCWLIPQPDRAMAKKGTLQTIRTLHSDHYHYY